MDHAIEADDGDDALSTNDSGYDDTLCSSESLRSSVYAYEEDNGRTYHAYHAGKYHVPNDEGEQERMDIHYHALRLSIEDKLFHAPMSEPRGILDVGAGTGIWAMDAADTYPGAEVVGFDLSPIQPTIVPPNLTFEVLDADESWDYGTDRFDLVHSRFMNGFSIKSWDHFYQEAYSCLRPGGWVENQEFDCIVVSDDGTIPANSKVQEWVTLWNQGMQMVGMTGRCDPEVLAQKMRDAGFVNVQIKHYKMPIGPWPKDPMLKEAGMYGLVAIIDGMQGLSMKVFTKILGWTVEALEVFLTAVRKEFKQRSVHSYWPSFVIMGQKPAEEQMASNTSFEAIQPPEAPGDGVEESEPEPMDVTRNNDLTAQPASAAPDSLSLPDQQSATSFQGHVPTVSAPVSTAGPEVLQLTGQTSETSFEQPVPTTAVKTESKPEATPKRGSPPLQQGQAQPANLTHPDMATDSETGHKPGK